MNDLINNQNTMLPGDDSHQASLTPGNVLGQHKVIRLLGRGGMGEVYEVEHAQMHKHYALKILQRAAPLMDAWRGASWYRGDRGYLRCSSRFGDGRASARRDYAGFRLLLSC